MSQPRYPLDYGAAVPKRFGRHLFGWVFFVALAILLFIVLTKNKSGSVNITLSEFADQLDAGNVADVTIDGDTLRGSFVTPIAFRGPMRVSNFRTEVRTASPRWDVAQWLLGKRGPGKMMSVSVENSGNLFMDLVAPLIPWLILFGFVWFFILRQLRKSSASPLHPSKPMPVVIVNPETPR